MWTVHCPESYTTSTEVGHVLLWDHMYFNDHTIEYHLYNEDFQEVNNKTHQTTTNTQGMPNSQPPPSTLSRTCWGRSTRQDRDFSKERSQTTFMLGPRPLLQSQKLCTLFPLISIIAEIDNSPWIIFKYFRYPSNLCLIY